MSRKVWRIGVDTPAYVAEDLSGKGAEITGGRWNAMGAPVVYASSSRALACLETLAHLNARGLPYNRYLVEIEIADDVWAAAARVETTRNLPVGWDAEPPGRVSLDYGMDWLRSRSSAILVLPSVIVPEESNVLINPVHPDCGRISARKVRRWLYDPRLLKR